MFPEGRALELLIAAVVALIVVGPKDLPILLRRLGQFMAKVRSMAAEFRASFDEMARQSELDELRKEVEAMRKGQLGDIASSATSSEMTQTFNEISQGLSDVGVSLNEPVTYPYAPSLTQTEHVEIPAEPAPKAKPTAKQIGRTAAARRVANRRAVAQPEVKAPVKAKASGAKARGASSPPPKAKASKTTVPTTAAPKTAAPKTAAAKATPKPAASKPVAKAPASKAAAKPSVGKAKTPKASPRARKATVS